MAVSQHTLLSRSLCVVSSERHSHSRYIPGKGRCLNAILNCSLPLARYTLNTEYLSTKTKQKGNMRALSHSDTDHCCRVRMKRTDHLPPNFKKSQVSFGWNAIEPDMPALLMLNLHGLYDISDMVKPTNATFMEEF